MLCAESRRLQAYFDGEVDALSAPYIERHVENCAACCALLQDLEQTRAALRRGVRYARTPPELRARIMRALAEESASNKKPRRGSRETWQRQPFWAGVAGGVGAAAIAATLAFFLLAPLFANPLVDDLVGAHARSLMPTHLIDVASTDKHTVKPWFSGHADVSPVVADFEQQGYRLIGGRADYLDHQRSAVVVYQHHLHIINVFSWAANERALPRNTTRNGYHLVFWRAGDLECCAVSDTDRNELLGLVRLLRALGARDGRE